MRPKLSLKFILAILLVSFLLSSTHAQVTDELADYLCEYAQRLYAQGDLAGAEHEFRKALMISPGNATAKEYLEIMGVDTQKLSAAGPALENKINVYKVQVDTLQKNLEVKNRELASLHRELELERALSQSSQSVQVEKLTSDKDAQIKRLEERIKTLDTFIAQELAQYQKKREALEIAIQDKDKEIADREAVLKARDNQLQAIKGQVSTQELENEMIIDSAKSSLNQLAEYKAKLETVESALEAEAKEVTRLNENLKLERDQLAGKESIVANKDSELASLSQSMRLQKEESVSKEKEIADKESTLQAKDKEIARLNDELTNQAEKLTSDKDREVSTLANQVKELSTQLTEAKNKLAQAEKLTLDKDGEVSILTDRIKELNNQLSEVKKMITQVESSTLDKDKQLDTLTSQLKQLDIQLTETKNKLTQAEKLTSDKDREVSTLANQVKELSTQLTEAKNKLAQAEKSAMDKGSELSSQLSETKNKLAQVEKLIPDKEKESLDKDRQIKVLEEQLGQLESSYAAQLAEGQDKVFKLRNILRLKDKKLEALKKADAAIQVVQLKDTMDKLKKDLQAEIETYKAKLELAKKGIVVTVLTDIVFNSGSAEIASGGREILSKISMGLKNLPPDYQIIIEGHTDNEPIMYSGWKSNWELSTARALSVLHYLVEQCGLDEDIFSVSGYGELRPVADNATEKGQRQNRRVEIVIQPPKIIKVKASELTE